MFGSQQTFLSSAANSSSSISAFGTTAPNQGQDKFVEFVKQIGGEMTSWEKSGQWLLSTLCPMKEYPLVPGFENTSFEELRVAASAAKNDPSALQNYHKMLAEKLEKHKQLRDAIRNRTPEALQMLKQVFYKMDPGSSIAGTGSGSAFGQSNLNSSKNNLFLNTTSAASNSLFGTPHSGTGFGGTGVFASPSSSGLFGTTQNKPVFGSGGNSAFSILPVSSSNNVFGSSSQNGTSQFGSAALSSGSGFGTSLFGNCSATSNSLFGGGPNSGSSLFGSINSNSLFGGTQPSSGTSLFGGGQTSSNSLFGVSPTTTNATLFGGGQNTNNNSMFVSSQNTTGTSLFGGGQNMNNNNSNGGVFGASSVSRNLFGNAATSGGNTFGSSTNTFNSGSSNVFVGQNSCSSLFGGNSAFSAASSTNSVFDSNQQLAFSTVANLNQPSVFSGASVDSKSLQNLESQTNANIFGNIAQNTGRSLFGGSAFGLQSNAASLLEGNSTSAIDQATSTFGSSTGTQNTTKSLFGGTGVGEIEGANGISSKQQIDSSNEKGNTSLIGQTASFGCGSLFSHVATAPLPSVLEDKRYTPLDKLSEEDLKQFQSETFTYVPLVPPPREFCF